MTAKAVTQALQRWQSDHTCHHPHKFNEFAKVELRAQIEMCWWSTSTFVNSCGCTALDMPEKRETTEQIDWLARQPSQVACFSGDLKCWEAWDYLRAQNQAHHTIDRLEERHKKRKRLTIFLEGTREGYHQSNIGTISKATLGELLRHGVERIDTIFSCTGWRVLNYLSFCSSVALWALINVYLFHQDVPETEGQDGCPWDGYRRDGWLRRKSRTDVPDTDVAETERLDGCPWDGCPRDGMPRRMSPRRMSQTDSKNGCPWDGCRRNGWLRLLFTKRMSPRRMAETDAR